MPRPPDVLGQPCSPTRPEPPAVRGPRGPRPRSRCPGWGSRSMRSSSGWSVASRRTGHGWNVRHPSCAAHSNGGRFGGADLVRVPSARELDPGGGNPFGEVLGGPLLEERLAVDAVGIALQRGGPVAHSTGDAVGDGQVVPRHVQLGVAGLGKVHLVRIREPHGPPADLQLDRLTLTHAGHGRRRATMAHIGKNRLHGSPGDAARQADARQVRGEDSARDAVRGEVGRVPGDRAPGRRRGRHRQPQRQASDPLLSRAGDRPCGAACPSAAWWTARSSSRTRGASTSTGSPNASTPPRPG